MRILITHALMLMLSLNALNQISLPQAHCDVDSIVIDSLYKGILYDSHQVTGYLDSQVVFQQQWDDAFTIRSLEVNTKDIRLFILWSGDGLSIRSLTTNTLNDPLGVTLSLNNSFGIDYADFYLSSNEIIRKYYHQNGEVRFKEKLVVDENDRAQLIDSQEFDAFGNLIKISKFEMGNIILTQYYYPSGMIRGQIIYSGESPPVIIRSVVYDELGVPIE